MKKNASKNAEKPELLTTERLCVIWEKVLSDKHARRALGRLAEAGFRISHLKPQDATFKHPTWADYIAAVPLISDKRSTWLIHRGSNSKKYSALVEEIREVAAAMDDPFAELAVSGNRDYTASWNPKEMFNAASIVEQFLPCNYYVRHGNARHALIAELRWTIRQRTGKPHDAELNTLMDAAFRAAGYEDGYDLDPTTLDRIEKRQSESRVKALRRFRERTKASPARISTKNRQY